MSEIVQQRKDFFKRIRSLDEKARLARVKALDLYQLALTDINQKYNDTLEELYVKGPECPPLTYERYLP